MNLPCQECRGKCCTYPVFTPEEFSLVRITKGVPEGAFVAETTHEVSYDPKVKPGMTGVLVFMKDGTCPYLKDGACSIYSLRPKVCRDYGVVPDLPCQYLYPKLAEQKQMNRIQRSRP